MTKNNKPAIKPKIMLQFTNFGKTGGPNISTIRIMESELLRSKFEFIPLYTTIGNGPKINLKNIFRLAKEIKEKKPAIIHISGMQNSGFQCMLAAFLGGCKIRVISLRGFTIDSIGLAPWKKYIFEYIIEPFTLLLATKIVGISDFTTKHRSVKKWGKNKTTFIHNIPPVLDYSEKNKYIRKEFGILETDVVFTTVSRIVYDKGYEILAKTIKQIFNNTKIVDIKFLIVGNGNYEPELRNLLSDEIKLNKVILAGKRNDVMNVLSESDVFVLPTLHENLGNVFLEAMATKKACIGTRVGGVPEVIENNITGILIPENDTDALSSAILKLYSNKQLRENMGDNGFVRFNEKFNADKLSRKFCNLYESLLDNIE